MKASFLTIETQGRKKIQAEYKYPQIRKCTLLNGHVRVRTFETSGKEEDREGSLSVLTNQANIKVNNSGGKNNTYHQQRRKTLSQQPTGARAQVPHHRARLGWRPLLLPSQRHSRPLFPERNSLDAGSHFSLLCTKHNYKPRSHPCQQS